MKDYNHKVYLSASWRKEDNQLTKYISKLLDKNGLLIVGDDPYFKNHKHSRELDYQSRVSEILSSCSGFVIILPLRSNPQTTSQYMFIELLLADKMNLPILIFGEEEIKMEIKRNCSNETILNFGNQNAISSTLDDYEEKEYNDHFVDSVSSIKLHHYNSILYLLGLSSNEERLNNEREKIQEYINKFTDKLITPINESFVFHITPFSMKKHHRLIAKIVLEKTGLPCYLANDSISSAIGIRQKGLDYINKSEFIISDISKLNPTCIFETGIAFGKSKKIYVIKNRKDKKLPFGLDDLQLHYYKNFKDLKIIITEICQGYRVRIINFELHNEDRILGIPNWYFEKNKFSIPLKLLILFILLGLLVVLALNCFIGKSVVNVFFGVGFTIISTMITISSKVQKYIESFIINNMKTLYVLIVMLIVSFILFSIIRSTA